MKRAMAVLATLCLALPGCLDSEALLSAAVGSGSGAEADSGDEGVPNFTGGSEAGATLPNAGVIRARVRNFTETSADVTLRFLLDDNIVHLSFLRVPAHTSTTFVGPEMTDRLEISGVDETGKVLPDALFRYGIDFEDGTEAVYSIGADQFPANVPPALTFLSPVEDVEVVQGGQLLIVIEDEDPDSSAAIEFLLSSDAENVDAAVATLAVGLQEDPDGDGDSFSLTVSESVSPGEYRLVGVIRDEVSTDIVEAPGRVTVLAKGPVNDNGNEPEPAENESPILTIIEPATDVEIPAGSDLSVVWSADDPDGNARIEFLLEPAGGERQAAEGVLLATFDEDSGISNAALPIPLTVPPGTYSLVGVISDDESSMSTTAAGLIIVLPPADGALPALVILQPDVNVSANIGEDITIAWEDTDEDDNALVTFYLDQDANDLNGGEVWIAEFDEDPDGAEVDEASVTIVNVEPGTYELLGVIFDGRNVAYARAAGEVIVLGEGPPVLLGACCLPNGSCAGLTALTCVQSGGTFGGVGTQCATFSCASPQACCIDNLTCTDVLPATCVSQGGTPGGAGTQCASFSCAPLEACCIDNVTCVDLVPAACASSEGTPGGPGTSCDDFDCQPTEACCFDDGTCSDLPQADCRDAGGTPGGAESACASTVCTTACCRTNGSCEDVSIDDCDELGDAQGIGTKCVDTDCPQPQACHLPQCECADLLPDDCTAADGTSQGPETDCESYPPPQPDCTITAPLQVEPKEAAIASVPDQGTGVRYVWTVTGDGYLTSEPPFTHEISFMASLPDGPGLITISVTIEDDETGCTCTDSTDVIVSFGRVR